MVSTPEFNRMVQAPVDTFIYYHVFAALSTSTAASSMLRAESGQGERLPAPPSHPSALQVFEFPLERSGGFALWSFDTCLGIQGLKKLATSAPRSWVAGSLCSPLRAPKSPPSWPSAPTSAGRQFHHCRNRRVSQFGIKPFPCARRRRLGRQLGRGPKGLDGRFQIVDFRFARGGDGVKPKEIGGYSATRLRGFRLLNFGVELRQVGEAALRVREG
jgi:hypothetical protein